MGFNFYLVFSMYKWFLASSKVVVVANIVRTITKAILQMSTNPLFLVNSSSFTLMNPHPGLSFVWQMENGHEVRKAQPQPLAMHTSLQ